MAGKWKKGRLWEVLVGTETGYELAAREDARRRERDEEERAQLKREQAEEARRSPAPVPAPNSTSAGAGADSGEVGGLGAEEVVRILRAGVEALRERGELLPEDEPKLTDGARERFLPPPERVRARDRPLLQVRTPSEYKAALELVAERRGVSATNQTLAYLRDALEKDLARILEQDGALPEERLLPGDGMRRAEAEESEAGDE
jgi:hypothetical protein